MKAVIYSLTFGTCITLCFFLKWVFKMITELPEEFYLMKILRTKLQKNQGKPLQLSISNKLIGQYEQEINELGNKLKEYDNEGVLDFPVKLTLFFILRMSVLIVLWYGYYSQAFYLSLLQFLILPYSLYSGISLSLAIIPNYFFSILLLPIEQYIVSRFFPAYLIFNITITTEFAVIVCILDHLVCFLYLFWTPEGKPVKISFSRFLQSFFYGFVNNKTFNLLVLLSLRGYQLQMTTLVLDWLLGVNFYLSSKLNVYYNILFFLQHRSIHIGSIYPDSHKFHHYLTDTNAFDTHLFGTGAPEEFFVFFVQILPCILLGAPTPMLSYFIIIFSLKSKYGGHTRKEVKDPKKVYLNFHADHHLYHIKNFGWGSIVDVLFKTAVNSEKNQMEGYDIERKEENGTISLTYIPHNIK